MKSLNASFTTEKNKTEGITPIRLFEVEYGSVAASKLYFAAWNENIDYYLPNTATPQTYTRFPIKMSDIEYSSTDSEPRVNMTVSNVGREITSYLLDYDGLRGKGITIIRTYKSMLTNPNACIVEKYYVDSATIDANSAQFSLMPKFVTHGAVVPMRTYRRNQCQWQFKNASTCGYVGAPTTCLKTLGSCEAYNNASRYGGFPGIPNRRAYLL